MRVILLQEVNNLGKKGDIKEVLDGYARNFLLPKKMAKIATSGAVRNTEAEKVKEEQEKQANLEKLRGTAADLKGKKVLILAKERDGKLFGSIAAKDIAAVLKKENLEIGEKFIIIKEAIKKIGEYSITIELAKDIQAKINLEIRGEK